MEAKIMQLKFQSKADGIKQKAETMKIFDGAGIFYAVLGNLVLLKIRPYQEDQFCYLVYNGKLQARGVPRPKRTLPRRRNPGAIHRRAAVVDRRIQPANRPVPRSAGGGGRRRHPHRPHGPAVTRVPPGYGKTTLMEYMANRLGITFVKINGPALGGQITSLDPAEARNASAREELDRLNLAWEMGDNLMIYLDDIQHCHPELLQKFIPLCNAQRKIEGVYQGRTRTYDLRGRKVAVVMAGNPDTERGEKFHIPDMLANRADTYNLGKIIASGAETNLLKFKELFGLLTAEESRRREDIKRTFKRNLLFGAASDQDPVGRVVTQLAAFSDGLESIGSVLAQLTQHIDKLGQELEAIRGVLALGLQKQQKESAFRLIDPSSKADFEITNVTQETLRKIWALIDEERKSQTRPPNKPL
jgi:hypothetical protein